MEKIIEITETIVKLLIDKYDVPLERIESDTHGEFKAFGLDSIDIIEMVIHLEDHYNITISDEYVRNTTTIEGLAELIMLTKKTGGHTKPIVVKKPSVPKCRVCGGTEYKVHSLNLLTCLNCSVVFTDYKSMFV